MLRIEFFGPMGAGKSTIYNGLLRREIQGYQLTPHIDAKKQIFLSDARSAGFIKAAALKLLFLNKQLTNALVADKTIKKSWVSLEDRQDSLDDFVTAALTQSKHTQPADRLIRTQRFITDLADLALLQDYHSKSQPVVHDEFLLQRGIGLCLGRRDHFPFMREYFRNVPLPDIAVYVHVPEEQLLAARVKQRPRESKRYINYIGAASKISSCVAELLVERSGTVVSCDGRDEPDSNVLTVLDSLTSKLPT